ncbi:MAG: hypothetical protein WD269_08080 [Acidimicrobiia bacterium]
MADGGVAGGLANDVDRQYFPGLGLVATTCDSMEGWDVADQVDVWFLPTYDRSVGMVEVVTGQIFESIVAALGGAPMVSR